jgi:hypothetical protein
VQQQPKLVGWAAGVDVDEDVVSQQISSHTQRVTCAGRVQQYTEVVAQILQALRPAECVGVEPCGECVGKAAW